MSTRTVFASSIAVRRSGLAASATAVWRTLIRVPFALQLVPILGAFLCTTLAYQRIAGQGVALDSQIIPGALSFVLLFVVLRLVDDLDDIDRDHSGSLFSAEWRRALRTRLQTSLAVCVALVALLNAGRWQAFLCAAAAIALAFAAPFGFKRLFPKSLAVGSLVFEGVPFLFFVYGYISWRNNGGAALPLAAIVSVIWLFFIGYEFWKFSRKAHTDAMQPYFLEARGIRRALSAFLVLAAVTNVALAHFAAFPLLYTLYAAGLPVAWLAWLNRSWPDVVSRRSGARGPLWAGTTFVFALELGLLVAIFALPNQRISLLP